MPLVEAIDSVTGAPGATPLKSTGGALWTIPAAVTGAAPSNSNAIAATSKVVKATAGTVFGALFTNGSAAGQYIQAHDSATLPADTAVPLFSIYIPAGQSFALNYPNGRAFATGIVFCNSSTNATKTIGSADCNFDVQFI